MTLSHVFIIAASLLGAFIMLLLLGELIWRVFYVIGMRCRQIMIATLAAVEIFLTRALIGIINPGTWNAGAEEYKINWWHPTNWIGYIRTQYLGDVYKRKVYGRNKGSGNG